MPRTADVGGFAGLAVTDARWFADGSLATLVTSGSQTTLHRPGQRQSGRLETRQYTGQALRILGSDTAMAVLVINNGTVQFHSYVPNTDSDGDGVLNTAGCVPAGCRGIGGHRRRRLSGFLEHRHDQADSTTGLTLDAFPNDSACWLSGHGSGGVCNYGATVPNYTPDQMGSMATSSIY